MPGSNAISATADNDQLEAADPEDLVALARGGDVDAVGALYDRHQLSIFRYTLSRVGDRHAAEDLTGEVFLRMVKGLPKYQPMQIPFRGWLFRIAHNLVVDHYRKHRSRLPIAIEEAELTAEPEGDPVQSLERSVETERLYDLLSRIDRLQCEVVALRFLSGLSVRETAGAVGKSEAAVKALQHRGLAALRDLLSQPSGKVSE